MDVLNIKLAAFDLDRTIVGSTGEISERTAKAIRALGEQASLTNPSRVIGHSSFIATASIFALKTSSLSETLTPIFLLLSEQE